MVRKFSAIILITALCALGASPTAQEIHSNTQGQQTDSFEITNPIPEKTRVCTPAEEQWWTGVREKVAQIFRSDKAIETFVNEIGRLREDRMMAMIRDGKSPDGPLSLAERELNQKVETLRGQREERIKEFVGAVQFGLTNNYFVPVDDTKLIILTIPPAEYTEDAKTNKITGRVILEAQFQADGHVTNARVITGTGHGLDEKAVEAINKILFLPEIVAGRFTTRVQKVIVSFSLL